MPSAGAPASVPELLVPGHSTACRGTRPVVLRLSHSRYHMFGLTLRAPWLAGGYSGAGREQQAERGPYNCHRRRLLQRVPQELQGATLH